MRLKEMANLMGRWYNIKVRAVMGPCCEKEVRILNKVVKWEPDKVTFEADDKRSAKIMNELGFNDNTEGREAPLAKSHDEDDGDDEPLNDPDAKRCRRLATTVNYLEADRPELQFTTSVLGRTMAKPTEKVWKFEDAKVKYEFPDVEAGGCGSWSGTRTPSGRDVRRVGGAQAGGLVTLGGGVAVVVESAGDGVDTSVAQSMANRQGFGKNRHLEVRLLWLQDMMKQGTIVVRKVGGKWNPPEVSTKVLRFSEMIKLAAVRIFPAWPYGHAEGGVDMT